MTGETVETADPGAAPRVRIRTVAVVLNRSAGALVGSDDPEDAVRGLLAEHGLESTFIPIDAGDLPARVALARDAGADAVVVVGGDGTVACAAQTLAGAAMPLGILPSGTMNILARDLALPIGDPRAAVRVLAEGVPRAIDVGEVNGHVFLCASMMGMPTRLARYREAGRGGPILRLWGRFAAASWRVVAAHRSMRLAMRTPDGTQRLKTPAVTVTVNVMIEGGSLLLRRGRLDEGLLGVYVLKRLHLLDLARMSLAALLGRWRQDEAVSELHVTDLSITSTRQAIRIMNDGEMILAQTPLHYRVRPRALWVIAPATPADPAT